MQDDKPTELSISDINNFLEKMLNGDYDIKMRTCFSCSKTFYPNYNDMECDECWFSRFPKKEVEKFYKSFLQ